MITSKKYRCVHCNTESSISTNHYGEVYSQCTNWSCRSNGTRAPRHECVTPVPESGWVPEPWKVVTLGAIIDVIDVVD